MHLWGHYVKEKGHVPGAPAPLNHVFLVSHFVCFHATDAAPPAALRPSPVLVQKTAEAELEGLEDDADLPIDQLLARYGYVVPTEGQLPPPAAAAKVEEEEDGSGAGPSSRPVAAAADEGSDAESERLDALLADMGAGPEGTAAPGRASMLAAEFATLSEGEGEATDVEEEAAGPSSAAARRTRRAAIGAAGERDSGAGGDEDEYRSGEDDEADDEATLEEEEAKAQAELGQEYKVNWRGWRAMPTCPWRSCSLATATSTQKPQTRRTWARGLKEQQQVPPQEQTPVQLPALPALAWEAPRSRQGGSSQWTSTIRWPPWWLPSPQVTLLTPPGSRRQCPSCSRVS